MSVAPPRQQPHKQQARQVPNGSAAHLASSSSSSSVSTSSATSDLRANDSNSQSFVNLTSGALRGVFGSSTSLSELVGDDSSTATSPSRRGSSQQEVLDQTSRSLLTGTKVNGSSSTATSNPPQSSSRPGSASKRPLSRRRTLPGLAAASGAVKLSLPTILVRLLVLFVCGVAYGEIARNLHDNHLIAAATLDIAPSRGSLVFSLLSGAQGIVLGLLLPFFDYVFPSSQSKAVTTGKGGADWSSIIRACAAFLGIAYGVRKLPWASTAQVAALWGLINPFLWYLLDATRNGFILSSITAIVGTMVFATLFPSHLPSPELTGPYIAVAVWIASANYCCSICFGNLGRRMLSFDNDATA